MSKKFFMKRFYQAPVTALLLLCAVCLSGCDAGLRQLGATEYGVIFRNLPRFLGGGIASKVHEPGALVIVYPWEEMFRIDTSVKEITWGFTKQGNYIAARALDGNEVALGVSIRYQVRPQEEGLRKLIDAVGYTDGDVEQLVRASTTAAVRLSMNELHTNDFLKTETRYRAVDAVKTALNGQLQPLNVDVTSINLDDFRFERTLEDGKVDASYQDKLNETQRIREEIEREKARVDTVIAQKQQEQNDVQAKVNREVAEAEGYKKQAETRGDAYVTARTNEAQSILAVGKAAAEGLSEKVSALSGPGGRALLKLEIARNLLAAQPRFFIVGSGQQGNSLDVKRTDVNELLQQAGIFEGLQTRSTIGEAQPLASPSVAKK
jgi:regulator of protease activity HflC (stomatin/prohibitin superfamily)